MSKKSFIAVVMTLVLVLMQSIVVSTHAQLSEEGNCEYTFDLNEMNTCAVNAYIAANKQLNQVLENVNSRLTDEHKIQLLEKAQTTWRDFRKSYCDFAGYPVFDEPGYTFHKHDCLERITKQHLKNLEQYAAHGVLTGSTERASERLDESDLEVADETLTGHFEMAKERLDESGSEVAGDEALTGHFEMAKERLDESGSEAAGDEALTGHFEMAKERLEESDLEVADETLTGHFEMAKERLDESGSEAAGDEALTGNFERASERLDAVYQDVMNLLYSPVEKRWLEKAHISWLAFRQDYCDLVVDQNGCLERVTRQQIKNLERYIEDLDV